MSQAAQGKHLAHRKHACGGFGILLLFQSKHKQHAGLGWREHAAGHKARIFGKGSHRPCACAAAPHNGYATGNGLTQFVAHGIGRADQMARQRGLSQAESDELLKKGAVGEAFGDFFDESGRTVFQMSTVSVELTKLQKNPVMLAVAAGKRKADAIIACTRHEAHESLITDEGAANEILLKLSALDDQ